VKRPFSAVATVPRRAMHRPQKPWMRRVSMVAVAGTISFASSLPTDCPAGVVSTGFQFRKRAMGALL
jgi:hypothetical protein